MHAKALIPAVFPILAAHALSVKRDDATPEPTPTTIDASAAAFNEAVAVNLLSYAYSGIIDQLPSSSRTQFTAYITNISGVPVVELSSIGGQAITFATSASGAVVTTFAGKKELVPGTNGAPGLFVSKALLIGVAVVFGATVSGAMMLL